MSFGAARVTHWINLFRLGVIGAQMPVQGFWMRELDPRWLTAKMTEQSQHRLRRKVFVRHLAALPTWPTDDMPVDVETQDLAAVGENYREAHIYQYYLLRMRMGHPCVARGVLLDTEEKARDYYFSYIELYRSMQARGYHDDGADPIRVGITASGDFIHIGGGTHRAVVARLLNLPLVQVSITHIDLAWALRCTDPDGQLTYQTLCAGIDRLLRSKRMLAPTQPAFAAPAVIQPA